MAEKRKYPGWIRWSLLIYSLLSLGVFLIYVKLHLWFFKVDWNREQNDGAYYVKLQKVLRTGGILRIKGNVRALHSPFLIGLVILGILVALAVFVFAWRTFYARTFMPLIVALFYAVPFIHFGDNVIGAFGISYLFVLIFSVLTAFSLKRL